MGRLRLFSLVSLACLGAACGGEAFQLGTVEAAPGDDASADQSSPPSDDAHDDPDVSTDAAGDSEGPHDASSDNATPGDAGERGDSGGSDGSNGFDGSADADAAPPHDSGSDAACSGSGQCDSTHPCVSDGGAKVLCCMPVLVIGGSGCGTCTAGSVCTD